MMQSNGLVTAGNEAGAGENPAIPPFKGNQLMNYLN
jgi:hypothetical protein